MTHRRSKFWNFFISFMPGAGQMYQGFLKRGTSLMSMFFAEIFIANIINIDWLLFGLPVIWFYAFFDSLNINDISDEEFSKLEDAFLFTDSSTTFKVSKSKFRVPAAVILIMAGCYILLENIFYMFRIIFGLDYDWWVTEIIFDYFPRFVFAGVIILAGLYLIKGKKIQLDNDGGFSGTDKDVL